MDIQFTSEIIGLQTAQTIGWLYALTSAARIVAYGPQVALVWRCRDGARSVSLITWAAATVSHLAAAVYGVLVMPDVCFTAIAVGNAVGSGAILWVAALRRYPYATSRPSVPAVSQQSADMMA